MDMNQRRIIIQVNYGGGRQGEHGLEERGVFR